MDSPRLFWGLLCFLCVLAAECFNVDVEHAQVFQGPQNSYFGFSVDHYFNGSGVHKILVGAPEAQTNQPDIDRGGAIYECMMSNPNCSQLVFDSQGDHIQKSGGRGFYDESKSRQWFGATVTTSGDHRTVM
ncbi:hypothetical protein CAPTEDRAFT_203960, partial [Capitella teleta]